MLSPSIVAALVGWVQRDQQETVEYLREDNRILQVQLGGWRLRLTDDEGPPPGGPYRLNE
jgi:hypothetical protein